MTIEERAKQYATGDGTKHLNRDEYDAYFQGATDQQKIDIEKLKDAMNRLMIDTKDKADIIKVMEEYV